MKQPFRLADLYVLKNVSQPVVSPDGTRVAFVVQGFRKKENDRYQNLWVTRTDGLGRPHRLTRGFTNDSAPAWSPDGRYLAFLSTREHEIEVAAALAAEEDARATDKGEGGAGGPPEADDKPKPQIWILDLEFGGEPRQLTWRDEGVQEFDWSPDGRHIVFSSRDPDEAQQEYLRSVRGLGKAKDKGPIVISRVQHKHDARGYLDDVRTHLFVADVGNRAVRRLTSGPCDETEPRWSPDGRWIAFVSNRTGDPDNNKRLDLWLIRPDGTEARRLTHGDVQAAAPRWSPDSRYVAFTSSLEPENGYVLRHLMCVEVAGATPVKDLAACIGEGWSTIGGVVPDLPGRGAAGGPSTEVGADPAAGPGAGPSIGPGAGPAPDPVANARVYPVPLRRTPVSVLTEGLDRPVFFAAPVWLGPRELVALAGDRGQTRLLLASLDAPAGFVFPVSDRMSTLWWADAAGGTVVVGLDRAETGLDLYALRARDLRGTAGGPAAGASPGPSPGASPGPSPGAPGADLDTRAVRLTWFNEELLSQRLVARHERILFKNSDGDTIEAIVVLPPGFDPAGGGTEAGDGGPAGKPAKPAPLLVNIHGGPMWYDSPGFRFDEQYWAGLGYVVLMVNYRGSTSYGEDFCRVIQGDWGPREHDDVMCGVEAVIQRGWADPNRLFCTGFSQGGIMTNWAVGHTDRFRAAASEHGMWDYVAAFGTDDCHLWWQDDLGVPWQNPEGYRRISPMSGVADIKTPLLITAGEVDWRCPLNQAEQLYLALKKRGVPTQLVIYQGERHAIGKPRRAIDRIRRISEWFARYGGQPFDDDSAEGYPGK